MRGLIIEQGGLHQNIVRLHTMVPAAGVFSKIIVCQLVWGGLPTPPWFAKKFVVRRPPPSRPGGGFSQILFTRRYFFPPPGFTTPPGVSKFCPHNFPPRGPLNLTLGEKKRQNPRGAWGPTPGAKFPFGGSAPISALLKRAPHFRRQWATQYRFVNPQSPRIIPEPPANKKIPGFPFCQRSSNFVVIRMVPGILFHLITTGR